MKYLIVLVALFFCNVNLWANRLLSDSDIVDERDTFSDSVLWEEISDPFAGLSDVRHWREPKYDNQEEALGWSAEAFKVPEGLEPQVKFWTRIYSELSQDQGLIHDSEDVTRIFTEVSFADINKRSDINRFRKDYLRRQRVEAEKQKYAAILQRLQQRWKSKNLNEEEQRIVEMFKNDSDPRRFVKAKERIRFQLGQRDKIIQGIFFSGRYMEEFEEIFRKEGLPIELARLPFVESSFNIFARSRVGASGLWQLMPSVLQKRETLNPSIDIRNHPLQSASIAARVLKNNYRMLQDWPRAVTGYNHGPTGVRRLSERCNSRRLIDLADLKRCKGRRLGFASRNFYPSFLAMLQIESRATQYYGQIFWSAPLNHVEIKTQGPLYYRDLLKWFGEQDRMAQLYNPHLLPDVRRNTQVIPAQTLISIPRESLSGARKWFAENSNPKPPIKKRKPPTPRKASHDRSKKR